MAAFTQALNTYQRNNPNTSTQTVDKTTGLVTSDKTVNQTASADDFANAYTQSGALGTEGNTSRVGIDYYNEALRTIGAGSMVK